MSCVRNNTEKGKVAEQQLLGLLHRVSTYAPRPRLVKLEAPISEEKKTTTLNFHLKSSESSREEEPPKRWGGVGGCRGPRLPPLSPVPFPGRPQAQPRLRQAATGRDAVGPGPPLLPLLPPGPPRGGSARLPVRGRGSPAAGRGRQEPAQGPGRSPPGQSGAGTLRERGGNAEGAGFPAEGTGFPGGRRGLGLR